MSEPTYPSSVTFDSGANIPYVSNRNVTFFFGQPDFTGYSPISSYTLYSAQDESSPYAISSSFYQYTVNNLTVGTDYLYSITATNEAGFTSPSTFYQLAGPGLPPNQPINVVVSTINVRTALLSWRAPFLQDSSKLRGYYIDALPNNFNTYPGNNYQVGLSLLPTQSSLIITYSNQPSTLAVYARTDGGYTEPTYAPFIQNNYSLRIDPYMFTATNSTITDVTSTFTFSTAGIGNAIIGTNTYLSFSSGKYLQSIFPISSLSTLSIWLKISNNVSSCIIAGDPIGSMNISVSSFNNSTFTYYPSTYSVNFTSGGNAPTINNYLAGGGGGWGGGASGGTSITSASGGGNYSNSFYRTIYYVVTGKFPGNRTSPFYRNPYGFGGDSTNGIGGLISLVYFSTNNQIINSTFISTLGSNYPLVPVNTALIDAYIWGGGGGGGYFCGGGAGAAFFISSIQYIPIPSSLISFIGGPGLYNTCNNAIGGGGSATNGANSGGGGGCSYISLNGNTIVIAGGGGGGGGFATPGGAGGEPSDGGTQPGSNGIGGTGPGNSRAGSTSINTYNPNRILLQRNFTNITLVNKNNQLGIYSNGILYTAPNLIKTSGSNLFTLGSTFTGNIGNVLAYSTALTDAQIMSNFQGTRGIYGV